MFGDLNNETRHREVTTSVVEFADLGRGFEETPPPVASVVEQGWENTHEDGKNRSVSIT